MLSTHLLGAVPVVGVCGVIVRLAAVVLVDFVAVGVAVNLFVLGAVPAAPLAVCVAAVAEMMAVVPVAVSFHRFVLVTAAIVSFQLVDRAFWLQ